MDEYFEKTFQIMITAQIGFNQYVENNVQIWVPVKTDRWVFLKGCLDFDHCKKQIDLDQYIF